MKVIASSSAEDILQISPPGFFLDGERTKYELRNLIKDTCPTYQEYRLVII